jgi:hypothetical protein
MVTRNEGRFTKVILDRFRSSSGLRLHRGRIRLRHTGLTLHRCQGDSSPRRSRAAS